MSPGEKKWLPKQFEQIEEEILNNNRLIIAVIFFSGKSYLKGKNQKNEEEKIFIFIN